MILPASAAPNETLTDRDPSGRPLSAWPRSLDVAGSAASLADWAASASPAAARYGPHVPAPASNRGTPCRAKGHWVEPNSRLCTAAVAAPPDWPWDACGTTAR